MRASPRSVACPPSAAVAVTAIAAFILPLSLLLTTACDSSTSDPPATTNTTSSVTQAVGPEGGEILVAGAKVTFPKGALAETKQITIAVDENGPPEGFVALSKVFKCEPTGTDFAVPVTMQMPFTSDNQTPITMFWSAGGNPEFKDIGGESADGKTMIATVKHFSSGFVGRKK